MKRLFYVFLMACLLMALSQSVSADEDAVYQYGFLPAKGEFMQAYVGDCMPYYEDGVYYIYYLKDGGDSYRHSIFLATTEDFIHYTEVEGPILESSDDEEAQDAWIGTGSVVKMEDTYYLFYTGHADSSSLEYAEKVMLAKGDTPYTFEKVADWDITPDDSLGQKRDFRDPQGYVDENGDLIFTITAAQDGTARILKYTVSPDLSEITYDGIIFTDPIGKVYNLECSDTFKIGDTYYLTYSAQDDVLWYAASTEPYGPYGEAKRLDGPLFYAAKHVEDGENAYMVGWARKSSSETSTGAITEWGGNLLVQQIKQLEDGSLVLVPVSAIEEELAESKNLLIDGTEVTLTSADENKAYQEICNVDGTFMLKGDFTYTGSGSFGLAFEFKEEEKDYKLITVSPAEQKLALQFKGGKRDIAETDAVLTEGETYSFTYIQENSLGVFYIDDVAALTVRLYRVTDKPLRLFAENAEVHFSNISLTE